MPQNSAIFLTLTTAILVGQSSSGDQPTTSRLVTSRIEERVVKTFDFDERELGNYEDLPMNWNQVAGPGFPRFLEPCFDDEVGHMAPPSFRLTIEGGSLGAHYLAKDIPVYPSSDYRITFWVRPAGLVHARACVSAYFLDHALQKIVASERHGEPVQGAGGGEPWTLVTVDLPGGFDKAAWIGLACCVEQPDATPSTPEHPRPIDYRDVHGTAWYDDITVLRLPRVSFDLNEPSHVFLAGQAVEFLARVADPDDVGLTAKLEILDAEQAVLQTHPVPVMGLDAHGRTITVADLPAGLFTARLSVLADSREILARQRSFVQLNPDLGPLLNPEGRARTEISVWGAAAAGPSSRRPAGHGAYTLANKLPVAPADSEPRRGRRESRDRRGHGFGLIVNSSVAADHRTIAHLLRAISPNAVKVSLWRGDTDDEAIVCGDPNIGGLLRALHGLDVSVVATLDAPPTSLAVQADGPRRTLLDVLSAPASQWRPHLALMLARYGPQIRAWQVGADAQGAPVQDERLPEAVAKVRSELQPLIGSPDLVVPVPIQSHIDFESLQADVVSITVPPRISASRLPTQLSVFRHPGSPRGWVTLESPQADRYSRMSRLIEFARRAIVAHTVGLETVFLPQPWKIETRDGDTAVIPDEEFILLRTLVQSLGGLEPVAPVWIGHGLQAWLFAGETGDTGAIAAWAEADGTGPQTVVADIGPGARQVDMWANVTETVPLEGGRGFTVDAMPTVLAPVPVWRGRMLSGFAVDEPTFRVTVEEHERIVTLTNPLDKKLLGTLRLEAPTGWRVQPWHLEIDLAAGESAEIAVSFRIPSNQAVGDYALVGRLAIAEEDLGDLTLRAPLYVRSPGLDVSVLTALDGHRLQVVQRITNSTEEGLSLRTFLIAPETPYETRLISNLAPGQTVVQEYEIEDASHLAGRCIRVSAQQVGGPLRNNQVIRLD
ncbi:MAG: hypothetical protein JXQ75_10455 [Phycisphaerae bacterium]|nr:hypothetical protein [Phycisphaerae bacterium]